MNKKISHKRHQKNAELFVKYKGQAWRIGYQQGFEEGKKEMEIKNKKGRQKTN